MHDVGALHEGADAKATEILVASPRPHLFAHNTSGRADRVIVSCFDEATCAQVREFDPVIEVGWLLEGVDPSSALVRARALRLNAVHPHLLFLDVD